MPRINYQQGDWFEVPISGGGLAVGLIARASPGGVLLGYFSGRERLAVPGLEEIVDLRRSDAVLVRRFGHLGF